MDYTVYNRPHELPVRLLDGDRPDTLMLLPLDALLELDNLEAGHDSPVRRPGAGAGTGRTEQSDATNVSAGTSPGSAPGRRNATHSNPAIRIGGGTADSAAGRSPELGSGRVRRNPGHSGEQAHADGLVFPPSAPITVQSAESREAAPIAITENQTVPAPELPAETLANEPTPPLFDGAVVLREQYPEAIDAVPGQSYSGRVLTINDTHLIHRSGQGAPVIHRLEDLPRDLAVDDVLNVRYPRDGGKAIDLSNERGGGRGDR